MRISKKLVTRQRGQSAVEFALLVPVLVVIVFAIIESGRIWMTINVLTGAAREGVRVAAVTAPDPALVENAVNNVLTAANIAGATITISGPNASDEVTVTVQIEYSVITGSIVPGLGESFTLTQSATMRWEG